MPKALTPFLFAFAIAGFVTLCRSHYRLPPVGTEVRFKVVTIMCKEDAARYGMNPVFSDIWSSTNPVTEFNCKEHWFRAPDFDWTNGSAEFPRKHLGKAFQRVDYNW